MRGCSTLKVDQRHPGDPMQSPANVVHALAHWLEEQERLTTAVKNGRGMTATETRSLSGWLLRGLNEHRGQDCKERIREIFMTVLVRLAR